MTDLSEEGRRKRRTDFAIESYFQWALIRALAFGERSWALCYAVIVGLSPKIEFLSFSGVVLFIAGVLFLGPVVGIFVFYHGKFLFNRKRARGDLPRSMPELKSMLRKVEILWLVPVLLIAKVFIDLYISFDMGSLFHIDFMGKKP